MIFTKTLDNGERITIVYEVDQDLESGVLFVSDWAIEDELFEHSSKLASPGEAEIERMCMEDFNAQLEHAQQEQANMLGDW